MNIDLRHGDCRTVMATMEPKSVDAIVTDPPYGLSLMGKEWDHGVPGVAFWSEALRVAKPGAHLLAFGGTRTFHRLAVAIEDAGWEIRDCIMWVYGKGFPKSLDVSKAIDKAAGAERRVVGNRNMCEYLRRGEPCLGHNHKRSQENQTIHVPITAPATDAAKEWDGWGTALKPAWEPIIVARKPFKSSLAKNILENGAGGINIDACRVEMEHGDFERLQRTVNKVRERGGSRDSWKNSSDLSGANPANPLGRWPANFIHDGSDEVLELFPTNGSMGSAARFFYCAKTSNRDRNDGCDDLPLKMPFGGIDTWTEYDRRRGENAVRQPLHNHHPTVKPTDLMTWLCKLVTPPNGVVLDPFCGSGSTGRGAIHAGAARFIGIDLSEDYLEIARRRIEAARHPMDSLLS